ncbi:MAG: hypothetical protein SNJ70_04100 [Armatimonadota bacterium]
MPVQVIQWVALFGMVSLGIIFVLEIKRWNQLKNVLEPRQRYTRIALILLIQLLFLLIIFGPLITGQDNPLRSLIYWSVCVLIALVVVVVAAIDLRYVLRSVRRIASITFQETEDCKKKD